MLAIVSLLNTHCRSRRDYFALIPRLNIQSLHHDGLAQAIISQADKSKWYLCPCAISHRDNIFTSFVFHFAPLGNGTYFEARRLADNSRWKRWTVHFFWREILFALFLCCFGGSVSLCIPMHQFHLVRNMFHLISRDCEVDYLKTDDTFIPRDFYIICYNIRFIFYLFLNYNLKLVSCLRYAIFSRNFIHVKVCFSTHNNVISW